MHKNGRGNNKEAPMSVHVEWLNARSTRVTTARKGEFSDSYGSVNDDLAVLLNYDEVVVIEGTREELLALAEQITEAVTKATAGEAPVCVHCGEEIHEEDIDNGMGAVWVGDARAIYCDDDDSGPLHEPEGKS